MYDLEQTKCTFLNDSSFLFNSEIHKINTRTVARGCQKKKHFLFDCIRFSFEISFRNEIHLLAWLSEQSSCPDCVCRHTQSPCDVFEGLRVRQLPFFTSLLLDSSRSRSPPVCRNQRESNAKQLFLPAFPLFFVLGRIKAKKALPSSWVPIHTHTFVFNLHLFFRCCFLFASSLGLFLKRKTKRRGGGRGKHSTEGRKFNFRFY